MKRILVIEDEPCIAHLIAFNFQQAGYQVAIAENGVDALRQVDLFLPHLIILDLLLPLQSGWDVLYAVRRHPRKQTASTPIIVISALCSPQLHNDLRHHGVEHCLAKPFSVTELSLLAHTLLSKPDATMMSTSL
ncbi:MAG: response regulator transcription factor [Candidatus Binatia bacterium]